MSKILVIDDDLDLCLLLDKFLSKKGYNVDTALKAKDAIPKLKKKTYDLVLCDYRLPDATGTEMIERIRLLQAEASIIMITGYSDVRTAVSTLRQGAFDYVTKPLYPDEILLTIQEALESKVPAKPEKTGKDKAPPKPSAPKLKSSDFIVGQSQASQGVKKHIELIAPTDMSALVIGETGTGKEYVARAIHQMSKRTKEVFVAIDCGALPKELAGSELFGHVKGAFTGALKDKIGSFESAHQGTLFLDEIGNLSYENQIKLLRVLQERKIKRLGDTQEKSIDVRLIAATNEELWKAVKAGTFREDLYYRINEFKIELKPLRERPADIPVFADYFLQLANQQLEKTVEGFEPIVAEKLNNYYWHGNLRELKNVIKRSVLLTNDKQVQLDSLPREIVDPEHFRQDSDLIESIFQGDMDLKNVAERAERMAIIQVLEKTGNNKSKTAEILKIDRKTLYNKLKAYNIKLS